jgi:hypothetical protein
VNLAITILKKLDPNGDDEIITRLSSLSILKTPRSSQHLNCTMSSQFEIPATPGASEFYDQENKAPFQSPLPTWANETCVPSQCDFSYVHHAQRLPQNKLSICETPGHSASNDRFFHATCSLAASQPSPLSPVWRDETTKKSNLTESNTGFDSKTRRIETTYATPEAHHQRVRFEYFFLALSAFLLLSSLLLPHHPRCSWRCSKPPTLSGIELERFLLL